MDYVGYACYGSMCPVGRTECVAYVYIAEIGKLFGEVLTVLGFLFAAETCILKEHYIALVHSCYGCCCGLACYVVIGYKVYRLAELLSQTLRNGR